MTTHDHSQLEKTLKPGRELNVEHKCKSRKFQMQQERQTVVLDVLRTKANRLDFGLFPERQRQRRSRGRDKDSGQ